MVLVKLIFQPSQCWQLRQLQEFAEFVNSGESTIELATVDAVGNFTFISVFVSAVFEETGVLDMVLGGR